MRLLQELRERQKDSDTATEEGKRRSAIEANWTEDEVRAAVMKGLEPS